ncbi:tyrosine-protein kinase receptor [Elysia marginata]|uniref:receptor protein-tyrosine kinase n=1 Tax=Elysia marginata TaxID=1093978 RepID=A0AAV4HRM3_9GAST|nr:tyrosine-protein kinase receptor [Elysia marginata]
MCEKLFDRRCLTDKDCSKMGLVLYKGTNGQNKCLKTCPANYAVELNSVSGLKTCAPCSGPCPKECKGDRITSIQEAQALTGCSKINGNLTIQIYKAVGNVADEMLKGLGEIKEITGKLHVHNSYLLLNLFFLKNLEIIHGQNETESLRVVSNENLEELFQEDKMKIMKIHNRAFFDGNKKLCESKIEDFKKYLNLSDAMVFQGTNGDKMPCAKARLNLTIKKITHESAALQWNQSEGDHRRVLSYIINYKEIKDKFVDVNIYQGRDACSEEFWMTMEKTLTEDEMGKDKELQATISELKPFTTYAVYIQAYTLSTASHQGMTQVETFTTNPWDPSKPKDVEVLAEGPHELRVKWTKPKKPNGIIDHYVVLYQREELNQKEFDKRDYCRHPVVSSKKKEKEKLDEKEKYLNASNSNCCACPKPQSEIDAEAKKQQMEIYFEDFLHGSLYCKRYNELPFKLDEKLESLTLDELSHLQLNLDNYKNLSAKDSKGLQTYSVPLQKQEATQDSMPGKPSSTSEGDKPSKNETVVGGPMEVIVNDTEIVLTKLEHFREYSIMVRACHKANPETYEKLCSALAITQGRTEPLAKFDKINTTSIEVSRVTNKSSEVIIKWGLPSNPNGLTVKFMLLYKPTNQENAGWYEMCISMREYYKHNGYRLTGLAPGNWTFKIQPISLGGDGSPTQEKYFYIPHPPGEEKWPIGTIIAIVLPFLLVIVTLTMCLCYFKQRFRKEDMTVISQNMNYIPSEPGYTMDKWEVDRSKIKTIREIGQGSFGMVYEGIATGLGDDPNEEIRVAVKTVNDRAGFNDRREFLKEATTMKAFDCYHVVKLLGVVSTGQPALVIMELMALGDLKNYLREHRPDEVNIGSIVTRC